MIRLMTLALLLEAALLPLCVAQPSEPCRIYMECTEAYTAGLTIVNDFGDMEAGGECWTTTEERAAECTEACRVAVLWLRDSEDGDNLPPECYQPLPGE